METPPWFQALRPYLDGIGFPVALHKKLQEKLESSCFDAGACFSLEEREDASDDDGNCDGDGDDEARGVRPTPYSLHCLVDMAKESDVFLIDHIATFSHPQSRDILREVPGLPVQIAELLGIDLENEEDPNAEANVTAVWNDMWPHLGCYSTVTNADIDEYPKFFLMDQVGLSIRHAARPSFACVPIIVGKTDMTLLWPLVDVAAGAVVTRDYLPGCRAPAGCAPAARLARKVRLLGFMASADAQESLVERARALSAEADALFPPAVATTPDNASSSSSSSTSTSGGGGGGAGGGEDDERAPLPKWSAALDTLASLAIPSFSTPPPRPLKVFCDRESILTPALLHEPAFITLVASAGEADVLYLGDHVKDEDFEGVAADEHVKAGKATNQMWFDGMLVSKEHLGATVNRHERLTGVPQARSILPTTYNCSDTRELLAFVQDFSQRSQRATGGVGSSSGGEGSGGGSDDDNVWIMKRFRGRQSIDYPITTSLPCALRHLDCCPRLACKYQTDCCLHRGRKFDLRYYVLCLSLEPLVLQRHALFSLRVANRPYAAAGTDLESFQAHFTVMNALGAGSHLAPIRGTGERRDPTMDEFLRAWTEEYPDVDWASAVQPKVDALIRRTFEAVAGARATEPPHPSGARLHPNSGWSVSQPNVCPARAMYGFDIILTHAAAAEDDGSGGVARARVVEPKLLEVQWAPDVDSTLVVRPSLWDEILKGLFLGAPDDPAMVAV